MDTQATVTQTLDEARAAAFADEIGRTLNAGAVQEPILDCFETGAGLRYEDYPRFHQFMAEDSAQTVTAQLFSSILPLVHGLESALMRGIDVLDAGCGCGSALLALAARFPQSRFTGYDLCADAIDVAATAARHAGLDNGDFAMAPLLYAISCVHCTPVSLGQGGAGLGTMWGWETALEMLQHAGFADIRKHVLPHDTMNVWFVARRSARCID